MKYDLVRAGNIISCLSIGNPAPSVTISVESLGAVQWPEPVVTGLVEVTMAIPPEAVHGQFAVNCSAENTVNDEEFIQNDQLIIHVIGKSVSVYLGILFCTSLLIINYKFRIE